MVRSLNSGEKEVAQEDGVSDVPSAMIGLLLNEAPVGSHAGMSTIVGLLDTVLSKLGSERDVAVGIFLYDESVACVLTGDTGDFDCGTSGTAGVRGVRAMEVSTFGRMADFLAGLD